jgi:hypothetical protein
LSEFACALVLFVCTFECVLYARRLVSVRACVHCICRCQHGAVIRAQTGRRARQGQTAGNCIAAEFERKRHGPWLLAFDFLFEVGRNKTKQKEKWRKQGKNCKNGQTDR